MKFIFTNKCTHDILDYILMDNNMINKLSTFFAFTGLILITISILCIIGSNDQQQEQKTFEEYCSNVSSGVHPDYKKQLNYCR